MEQGFSDVSQTSLRSSVTSTSSNEIPVQAEDQITIPYHDGCNLVFDVWSLEIPELPEIGWIPEKPTVRRSANGTIIDVASAVDIQPVLEALIIDVASAVDIPPVPEALIIDVASAVDISPVPEARGELRSVDCFELFDIDTLSETNSDRSALTGTVTDETALMPQQHATTSFDLDPRDQK
jgi:hypothetical protein